MDNLRGMLGIRSMESVPNGGIRESCGVKKAIDERIDEGMPGDSAMWRGI